jgi:hypothetical protein
LCAEDKFPDFVIGHTWDSDEDDDAYFSLDAAVNGAVSLAYVLSTSDDDFSYVGDDDDLLGFGDELLPSSGRTSISSLPSTCLMAWLFLVLVPKVMLHSTSQTEPIGHRVRTLPPTSNGLAVVVTQGSDVLNLTFGSTCMPGYYQIGVHILPCLAGYKCLNCAASQCPVGTFAPPKSGACERITACPSGTYLVQQSDASQNVECKSCLAGSFQSAKNHFLTTCQPCSTGTFSPDSAESCTPHSLCPIGYYMKRPGTLVADVTCTICSAGTYRDSTASAQCQNWTTCQAGFEESQLPTASSNRVCAACNPGSFNPASALGSGEDGVFTACMPCPAGSASNATQSTSCPICMLADGVFQPLEGQPTCQPLSICAQFVPARSNLEDNLCYSAPVTVLEENIGHQYIQSTPPFAVDFIASFLGSFGGASLSSTTLLGSEQDNWGIQLDVDAGLKLSARLPEGVQAQLVAVLEYCLPTDGQSEIDRRRRVQGLTGTTTVSPRAEVVTVLEGLQFELYFFVEGQPVSSTMVQLDSRSNVTRSNGCIFFDVTTLPFQGDLELDRFLLLVSTPLTASSSYELQSGSYVGFKYTGVSEALASDPGVLASVRDTTPPTFESCPSSQQLELPGLATSTVVSWQAVTASDNFDRDVLIQVDIFDVNNNFVPVPINNSFTARLSLSPYRLVYQALDDEENQAECEFSIALTYVPDTFGSQAQLGAGGLRPSIRRGPVTVVSQALIHSNVSGFATFTADLSKYTQLRFEVTQEPGLVLNILPSNDSLTQLLPSLRWQASGPARRSLDVVDDDTFATLELSLNGTMVAELRLTAAQLIVSNTEIRLVAAAILITSPLQVDSIVLSIYYPGSRSSSGDVTYVLSPSSFLAFQQVFFEQLTEEAALAQLGFADIIDLEPPIISNCPSDIQVEAADGTTGNTVTWIPPTATDNIAIISTSEPSISSGQYLDSGVYEAVYTFTDGAGNTAVCSFQISVIDSQPPTFQCPPSRASLTLPPDSGSIEVPLAIWQPTNVQDNSVKVPTITHTNLVAQYPAHQVVVNITDESDNVGQCIIDIEILDGSPPVISNCPADIREETQDDSSVIVFAEPTAVDNSGAEPLMVVAPFGSSETFPVGRTTVTYTASDQAGNEAVCSFDVLLANPAASTANDSTLVIVGVIVSIMFVILAGVVFVMFRRKKQTPISFDDVLQTLQREYMDASTLKIPEELPRGSIVLVEEIGAVRTKACRV